MSKLQVLTVYVIGIVGMVISLIGILVSNTNDVIIISLFSFLGFSCVACSMLLSNNMVK
jgi:hypothetical protein